MTHDTPLSGKLFLLVGPAGTGKNSLMRAGIEAIPGLRQLPTAVSRPRRTGELDGREHYFVTTEQFEAMIADGDLLEWIKVHGTDYYGMVRSRAVEALQAGELLIADIDYVGARAVRLAFPDNVITLFVTPPRAAELVDRMMMRGETLAEISRRLLRAPAEYAFAAESDYVILNDVVERAARQMVRIIRAEAAGRHSSAPSSAVPQLVVRARLQVVERDDAPRDFELLELIPGELPHQAALRAAAGLRLDWGDKPMDSAAFVPPDELVMDELPGGIEAAIYVYRAHHPDSADRALPAPGRTQAEPA